MNAYQSRFFGKDTTTWYYFSLYNRCLMSVNGILDESSCEDYSINSDSVFWHKIYDTDEKILGHSCRIIEYQGRHFLNRYYVSTELHLAPNTYKYHDAYNWSFYGNKTNGGLILKMEHIFDKYTMHGIATRIIPFAEGEKAMEVGEADFRRLCRM